MSIREAVIRWLGGESKSRTFVMDSEFHRSEELRVDRLGPDEDDLNGQPREAFPYDPWRPRRTLR